MTENDHKSLVLHLYIISYNYIYIYIHTCHYVAIAMISQFVWLGTPIFDQKPTGSWLGSNVWAQKFKTKHSRRTTPNIGGQPAKRQKMCLFLFMALPSIVGFPVQGSTGISSNMSQLSLLPRRCLLDPLGGSILKRLCPNMDYCGKPNNKPIPLGNGLPTKMVILGMVYSWVYQMISPQNGNFAGESHRQSLSPPRPGRRLSSPPPRSHPPEEAKVCPETFVSRSVRVDLGQLQLHPKWCFSLIFNDKIDKGQHGKTWCFTIPQVKHLI